MHEDSVNFVASFCIAAFMLASGLNKIDANPKCPDDARGDDARCSRGTQGGITSPTGARRGHRERASANGGLNTHVSGAGLRALVVTTVFASRGPRSSVELPHGIASTRSLDAPAAPAGAAGAHAGLRTGRVMRHRRWGTTSPDGKWHTQRTRIRRDGQDMGVPNAADCITVRSRPLVPGLSLPCTAPACAARASASLAVSPWLA
jgi:hypothetical protein